MKPSKGVDTDVRALEAAGLTHAVLVHAGGAAADLLAAIARDPGRLRGVVAADPALDATALDRLHAGGVRAVRVDAADPVRTPDLATPAWSAFLARVLARGWHVEVLPAPGRLGDLLPTLAALPVPVVIEGSGNAGPGRGALTATLAAAAELAATRPVWVKLAPADRTAGADPAVLAAHWERVLGPDFLVWGSAWRGEGAEPERDYASLRAEPGKWVGVALARRILWDNAARLYGF